MHLPITPQQLLARPLLVDWESDHHRLGLWQLPELIRHCRERRVLVIGKGEVRRGRGWDLRVVGDVGGSGGRCVGDGGVVEGGEEELGEPAGAKDELQRREGEVRNDVRVRSRSLKKSERKRLRTMSTLESDPEELRGT
jgi:hypothetical protein